VVKRAVKFLWYSFLSGIVILFLWVGIVLLNPFGWFGEIPGFETLENPDNDLSSSIYSSDGFLIQNIYKENRVWADFEDISPNVFIALISTEDERFEEHSGVDMQATLRVVALLGRSGGGSTITQQLAKNLFNMRRDSVYTGSLYASKLRMFIIKTKEWITAARLEREYTKREIITMYLNTVRFGTRAVGIRNAARIYFDKSASELNMEEAATLIGSLKAST